MRLKILSLHLMLASLATLLPLASAAAQARIGMAALLTAVVKEDVSASLGAEAPKPVTLGEDVFADEKVITTGNGKLVIEFRDRSTLELGPHSTVIIDSSVFNPLDSISEKSLTIAAGAFRYMSGVAVQNSKTDLHTPEGTLGIRGSVVIGEVTSQGVAIVPIEGQSIWTNGLGSTPVPTLGSVIARGTGKAVIVAQGAATLAIVKQVNSQVGEKPPALPNFPADKLAANAADHVVPANKQAALQGVPAGGATGEFLETAGAVFAKGGTGQAQADNSDAADNNVAVVLALAIDPQASVSNQGEILSAVFTMLQTHSDNQSLGLSAVLQELGNAASLGQLQQAGLSGSNSQAGSSGSTSGLTPPPPTPPTLPPPPLLARSNASPF